MRRSLERKSQRVENKQIRVLEINGEGKIIYAEDQPAVVDVHVLHGKADQGCKPGCKARA